MCGIAGIFHQGAVGPELGSLVRRMTDAIRHRGPDGDGFHVEPGLALGHRRLAIVDVTGGAQPMTNEDGSVVIVFNGEIYNHLVLRQELQRAGHVFRNLCDTEAIVHAWEEWGPACLSRLSGMFAFALWDRNRGQLLLARDRLGKKPIYWTHRPDGSLAFGSELAALLALPDPRPALDPAAIDDYFAFGYVPEPGSIYAGVHRLPAASYLLFQRGGGQPRPVRYWDIPHGAQALIDPAAAESELIRRLRAATEARLMADVPLGAFLSGGLDSGAVVAMAAGLLADPVSTFTIGFTDGNDERPLAALVAERYRTRHHADATAIDYIDAAADQARIFGEPFGDHSAAPTLAVAALARRDVTVALSGDGGDEVLGGYRRYRWHVLAEQVRSHMPAGVRRRVLGELARAYPKLDRAPRWLRAKHTLTELSLDSALGYYRTVCKLHHDRRRALFAPGLRLAVDGHDPADRIAALIAAVDEADPLRQAQHVDILSYLPSDILTKVDRTSMAVSLEVRAPFLDHDLVAWGVGLPASLKLRGGTGKQVLRRALRPLLPAALLDRPKQGFAASITGQFRAGAERLRGRLLAGPMLDSGLFDAGALGHLIDEHASGRSDHSQPIWQLLVFEGFLSSMAAAPASLAPGRPDAIAAAA